MASLTEDEPVQVFNEDSWRDVIAAMDRTYSELVDYQELLEAQNRELDELRQFMSSVLASVSDMLIVLGKDRHIERTGGAIKRILELDEEPPVGTSLDMLMKPDEVEKLFQVINMRWKVRLDFMDSILMKQSLNYFPEEANTLQEQKTYSKKSTS